MFMGVEKRVNYALVQKCLRLGGASGNLDTPRTNPNFTSLFEMLGSGLFDVSQDVAVAYFVEVLASLGLRRENLLFTTLANLGFELALERAGIRLQQIRVFADAKDIVHEWSFGEGDLHGCGVVAWHVPEGYQKSTSDSVLQELSHFVQIGRIVHIVGVARGASVETFPYAAYDLGLGLSRVELALSGNCEVFLRPWRVFAAHFQAVIAGLGKTDAHYLANLYRIVVELVGEGLLPGTKKQAYALRKVIRLLIEEIWMKSGTLVDIPTVLTASVSTSPSPDLLISIFSQEEKALRAVLSVAAKKQREHPDMSLEELRSTFGIRPSLLRL